MLPRYAEDEATLRANIAVAQRHLERRGASIGFAASSMGRVLERAMAGLFRANARGLCEALARSDEAQAIEDADRLVGLRPGLTPAHSCFRS